MCVPAWKNPRSLDLKRFCRRIFMYFRTPGKTNVLLTECLILVHSAQFIAGGGCVCPDFVRHEEHPGLHQEERIGARNRQMV